MAGQDRSIPNGGNEVYQLSNGTGNSRAQAASLPATSTSLYPPWSSLRALIPFPKRFVHRSRQLSVFVLPSFLRNYDSAGQEHYGKRHVFTALDGLRGWACLLVFNFHFLFTYTHKTMIGWGFGGENWGIHQLPIIHMLISGHVMVAIFFVISGYVLSYKPLKLIRSRSWDQAFCALASSTFRRGLRLYVPSIVGMLWVLVAVRLGCFDYATKVRDEGHTILGTNEQHPPIFSTRKEQIADWYLAVVHLIDPWNWNIDYNFYNPHLWTIPVEFRCSMVLFLTIITVSRMQPWKRLVVTCGFIWYCVRWSRWDVVLFLAGMVMAEIDQIYNIWEGPEVTMVNSPTPEDDHANDLEKNHPTSSRQTQHWTFRPLFWYFFFLLGLFLGSSPNNSPDLTPGFRTLSALTPRTYTEPHRFLQSLGAILIVCSINHSPTLQSPFTTPFAQYLGKISFAFYIVHGPVLHSLGYSIMPNIWYYTGKDGDWGYCLGFAVGWCVCSVVSVWLADVFWRVVDVRSVRLARWVEGKVSLSGM
ncbi:hypothetical protein AJ80_07146 [Polytolypa hystricis UAMH7299]|uniref:Acyltransferase 3 domain-containing protein n=1 Tax=Polytolypa hystricis (strain UAMH7299) TaxID=1447883 RepID=A0A2B7XQZ1_POLH7|nr:hypothetical protein AJ80_07146 [Polytolypa hystricis UAMH7299]